MTNSNLRLNSVEFGNILVGMLRGDIGMLAGMEKGSKDHMDLSQEIEIKRMRLEELQKFFKNPLSK